MAYELIETAPTKTYALYRISSAGIETLVFLFETKERGAWELIRDEAKGHGTHRIAFARTGAAATAMATKVWNLANKMEFSK
jgi:hypothetical protein